MTPAHRTLLGLAWPLLLANAVLAADSQANQLTEAHRQAGWRLLFDGRSTAGWRNFKKPGLAATNAWVVEDGWLKKVAGRRGGDIITAEQFTDFELEWEWRIPPRGNNGLKYFITEARSSAIGHEYQMIDDSVIKNPKGRTASFYDVLPPRDHQPVKLAPEVNHSRLVVRGNHVEHWLNGEKVLEYECGSEEVKAAVARSKFRSVPGFGDKLKGHILLTDHTDECSYRNLKLRELPGTAVGAR
jgi:hypothetical protein